MNGATLQCFLHDGSRCQEPGKMLPAGVFLPRVGNKFMCGVEDLTPAGWYKRDFEVGLLRETAECKGPVTLTAAGFGDSVIMTNTGAQPLTLGQKFFVDFPTKEDAAAQRECVHLGNTKMTHGSDTKELMGWGALMATVGTGTYSESRMVEDQIKREISGGATGLVYSLGKLQSRFQQGDNSTPQFFYNAVTTGNVQVQALAGVIDVEKTLELAKLAMEAVWKFRPRVWGIVQQHAIGGFSNDVPTGSQFYGTLNFEF